MNENLKDYIESLSLLTFFVFLIFEIKYTKIKNEFNNISPKNKNSTEYKNYKTKIKKTFLEDFLPTFFSILSLIIIELPIINQIKNSYVFTLKNYDFIPTSIIFIFIFQLYFLFLLINEIKNLLKNNRF